MAIFEEFFQLCNHSKARPIHVNESHSAPDIIASNMYDLLVECGRTADLKLIISEGTND